ncbi:MAG: MFS transporter [Alphaproteobacteria bacterium]
MVTHGKLPTSLKLGYGAGQMTEAAMYYSFEVFLFFFYNQVVGLPGFYCAAAIAVAMLFDAMTDPLVGSLSDNWKSKKWGRRHPFMFAAALPMVVSFIFIFSPPAGMEAWQSALWLGFFSVLVRGSATLWAIPFVSLNAEMTDNYDERTSVAAWRQMIGHISGVSIVVVAFAVIFAPTEQFPQGQLNPNAYGPYTIFCAIIMVVGITLATLTTRKIIPNLPKPPENPVPFSFKRIFDEVAEALTVPAFRNLFIGLLILFAMLGVAGAYRLHLGTFYWQLDGTGVLIMILAAYLGIVAGVPLATVFGRFIEKHHFMTYTILLTMVFHAVPIFMREAGILPENGTSALLWHLGFWGLAGGILAGASLVIADSMMADITDAHEHQYEKRNEGIFFGARSLAVKASAAAGVLLGGVGLDLIGFPPNAAEHMELVTEDLLFRLAMMSGPYLILMGIVAAWFVNKYDLSRAKHQALTAELEQRRLARQAAE